MGKTLGFSTQEANDAKVLVEDYVRGDLTEERAQEYKELEGRVFSALHNGMFVAELSYHLEYNTPIISDFIRLNLSSSEPLNKGKGIIVGKRGVRQSQGRERDDYLPVYDSFSRMPKVTTQQQIDEQEMLRRILTSPTGRGKYLDVLSSQLAALNNVKIA